MKPRFRTGNSPRRGELAGGGCPLRDFGQAIRTRDFGARRGLPGIWRSRGQLGLLESPGPARGASFAAWSRLSLVVELLACGAILYHVLYVRSF